MVIIHDIDNAISGLGDGRHDRFRRNSLMVLRERFRSSEPPFRVNLRRTGQMSATDMAVITRAVQDATARVALLLLHPNEDRTRVDQELRRRAELIPQAQSSNSLFFHFPEVVAQHSLFPEAEPPHLAEQAVRELMNALPETAVDVATLQTLPARRVAIRKAVATLADAVATTGDVALTLVTPGLNDRSKSVLTREQAGHIGQMLTTTTVETTELGISGILDGMRTRRRLFYIVSEDPNEAHEFEGAVAPDMMPRVQEAINMRVHARVSRTVTVAGDGSRSHPAYSLLSLQVDPTLH